MRSVLQRDSTARYIYEQSRKDIERINKEIKGIEKMLILIEENESVLENYELVRSIKGIALINAVAIIVATQNFICFDKSRQFACYAGMAPFGKQSGSSINSNPHVSRLANKTIKTLLTQAAQCAVRHDSNLRHYYERKLAEGKQKQLVINNVRNKLIHRIFALVRNKQRYQVAFRKHLDKMVV
jgi:transposase